MQKFAITVGEVEGKLVVLAGPSDDVEGQIAMLEALTEKGGKLGGKRGVVTDAVIVHSSKGEVKARKDMPGKAKTAASVNAIAAKARAAAEEAAAKAEAEPKE